MAGGSDVAEATAALSCVQCGKPAHLQYVFCCINLLKFVLLVLNLVHREYNLLLLTFAAVGKQFLI